MIRLLLICVLLAGLGVSVWAIAEAYRGYATAYPIELRNSTDARDNDLKSLARGYMQVANNWTTIVAITCFTAGGSVVVLYELLRRKKVESVKPNVVSADNLDCRIFFGCGVAFALVTAAFGTMCWYVGYYTTNDALDFRASELALLVWI